MIISAVEKKERNEMAMASAARSQDNVIRQKCLKQWLGKKSR
jgi:hypothetical protein